MGKVIRISEAIENGIKHLREEVLFGKGSMIYHAQQKVQIALMRDNEPAALYWKKVLGACRRLENMQQG